MVRIHVVLSIFFAGIGTYHLILNWRVFVSYVMSKMSKGFHHTRELILAIAIVLLCTFGAYFKMFLSESSSRLTMGQNHMGNESGVRAPIAHAEALSLVSFTTRWAWIWLRPWKSSRRTRFPWKTSTILSPSSASEFSLPHGDLYEDQEV